MPDWENYRKRAKDRGALAFELFVVESTPVAGPQELQATLMEHLAYQKEMEAAGKLFMAGPMSDVTGEQMQGNGLIVYRAASMGEAKAMAENDPMHAKGVRSFTLRKWLVNEGSLSLSISLSSQKAKLT